MISEETDNLIGKQDFQFILNYISRLNSQININKDDFIILRLKNPKKNKFQMISLDNLNF